MPFIHSGSYTQPVDESVPVSQLPAWFEGIKLNWAENFLWSRSANDAPGTRTQLNKEDSKIALTEVREGNTEVRHMTWAELRRRVAELATALKERGVERGDRVVMVGAHSATTLLVFLATTWLGGLFSSSSTDMGVGGLLQRTVQIDPKFVFFDDGAMYNGKTIDLRDKIQGVMEGLQECPSFKKIVVVQRFKQPYSTDNISNTERFDDFLLSKGYKQPPPMVRIGFQDPMIVYYSSGTTGIPKAIVHGVGPLLISTRKEGILHRCVTPDDVGLQYTTTGWIMYLSSVSQLALGARAVLYDGSPFIPDPTVLLKIAEQQGVTTLGLSPRWMTELMKRDIAPRKVADLSKLRRVVSTGMVLPDQMFEWFYDVAFPPQVQLANISGGTDIAGCFVLENPLTPVHVGGCVGGSLGVPIAVYDHDLPDGSDGKPLPLGQAGDLVATAAFPNVPLFLWNDDAPSPGKKYRGAYFDRFNKVWAQGDFCVFHPKTGGMLMLGRSDGVLNPSGIRFGSSDIYAVLERCFPAQVAESLCVGQRRPSDLDERVVLFLIMKQGHELDKKMVRSIKDTIAKELTKRHVPKYIFQVPEIPVTVNGKKVELPVKSIISGKTVKPSGTLLNPGSLEYFYRFQKVEELDEPVAKL
ncbi:acetoacetyl-CoA synthase [Pochonia chlamydosporia 170]|uniref:Acetoacetyl-CoA synthase n=1 Tax=Pochonia chlamydosporia 170 TaxID=1380566 RepID=A0A179FH08_METCM|nr:acetoacetyl-CoA synthase [Pochonia chlamydosporia 170]OAQ64802.1 acetoacetyl-CoA synthase [Pochonia chlamydosporia 170]